MSKRGHWDEARGPFILVALAAILILLAIGACANLALASDDGPPLTVTSPEEDLLINFTDLQVTGSSSAGVLVKVLVENSTGTGYYQAITNAEGAFSLMVDLAEGFNHLVINASEEHTANSTIVERDVKVDLTPPRLEIASPKKWPTYTRFHMVAVVFTYDMDPNNPMGQDRGMGQRVYNLTEGENLIEVVLTDEAGNQAMEQIYVIADWTPPAVSIERPWPDPYLTNNGTVRFSGRVGAGAVNVWLEHKGGSIQISTIDGDMDICATWEHFLELGPEDLDQLIIVKAVDHVGNEATDSVHIIYDIVPPFLQIDTVPTDIDQPIFYINGTTDIEIEFIRIGPALFPVIDGEFSVFYNLLIKGRNTIIVEVYDEAGNAAREELVVYYERDPPSLKVDRPEKIGGGKVRIKGTTDKNVVTLKVEGVEYPVVLGKFDVEVNVTDDDMYLVEVWDPAGNTASREVSSVDQSTPGPGAGVSLIAMILAIVLATRRKRD